VRQFEAASAATYWERWVWPPEAAPRFASRDRSRGVPKHWLTYHGRRSVLRSANGNRKAERPANALVNYLYGCLEAEAILACQAVGLDPGLSIVHAAARSRQSFALDLLEPVRPEIDAYVLDLLAHRTFRKVEFTETTDGHVRLKAPVTHELAETVPQWARSLAPYAEYVAHVIGQAMAGKYQPVTPLTGRRGPVRRTRLCG
jgi:CRISPR-associated endonuclease Cas1